LALIASRAPVTRGRRDNRYPQVAQAPEPPDDPSARVVPRISPVAATSMIGPLTESPLCSTKGVLHELADDLKHEL